MTAPTRALCGLPLSSFLAALCRRALRQCSMCRFVRRSSPCVTACPPRCRPSASRSCARCCSSAHRSCALHYPPSVPSFAPPSLLRVFRDSRSYRRPSEPVCPCRSSNLALWPLADSRSCAPAPLGRCCHCDHRQLRVLLSMLKPPAVSELSCRSLSELSCLSPCRTVCCLRASPRFRHRVRFWAATRLLRSCASPCPAIRVISALPCPCADADPLLPMPLLSN